MGPKETYCIAQHPIEHVNKIIELAPQFGVQATIVGTEGQQIKVGIFSPYIWSEPMTNEVVISPNHVAIRVKANRNTTDLNQAVNQALGLQH